MRWQDSGVMDASGTRGKMEYGSRPGRDVKPKKSPAEAHDRHDPTRPVGAVAMPERIPSQRMFAGAVTRGPTYIALTCDGGNVSEKATRHLLMACAPSFVATGKGPE